jgi:dihydrofolate reductase
MRKIVAFDRVSADGYFAAPDGQDLSWAVPDEELDRGVAERTAEQPRGAGTMLLGRRTYEMFESFWPHVLDRGDTAPDPHAPGRHSPEMRAMAVWIDEATKYVVSRSRPTVTWNNSRLLRDVDAAAIEAIRREPGGDIMVFGSGTVASRLTELGLVDEYQLVVAPVLLGGGRPLIEGVARRTGLELLGATSTRAGNVKLRYAPRR